MSGERIGPFVVERELGRGAMGVVFAARDPVLGREVAVKVVAGFTPREEDLARFQREAVILSRLRHPNLLTLHGVGFHKGRPYLATDRIQGESLHDLLRRQGQLSVVRALEIVEDLARGLAYAHDLGVVHRDVKPDNVLMDGQRPVLIDFGIASFRGTDPRLTGSSEILGTPSYMAPEQTDPAHDPHPTMDVYALGATLFTLLAGRPPFEGRTLFETLDSVTTKSPPVLSALREDVPPEVTELCLRCLAKSPRDRPPSALSLAEEIAALRAPRPGPGAGVSAGLVAGLCCAFLGLGALLGVLGAPAEQVPAPSVEPAPAPKLEPTPPPSPPEPDQPPPPAEDPRDPLEGPPPPAERGPTVSIDMRRGFSLEREEAKRRVVGLGFLGAGEDRLWAVCESGQLVVILREPPWTQVAAAKLQGPVALARRAGHQLVVCPQAALVPVPLSDLEVQRREFKFVAHELPPFAPGKSTAYPAALLEVPQRPSNVLASYFDFLVELDLRDGTVVRSWKAPGLDASEALCWLSADLLLVGGTRGEARLFSPTGEELRRLPVRGAVNADVAGEGEGRVLAVMDWDGVLWAFDRKGEPRWRRRAQHARDHARSAPTPANALPRFMLDAAVAVGPRGELIATGGAGGEVMLWGAEDGALRGVYQVAEGHVNALAWSADRRDLLVGASDGIVYLIRVLE